MADGDPLAWPPTLADYKAYAGITDMTDDQVITTNLASAVATQRHELNLPDMLLEGTDDGLVTATFLRVDRLRARRNSPDGIVGFGEFGPARVSGADPDVVDLEAPYRPFVFGAGR